MKRICFIKYFIYIYLLHLQTILGNVIIQTELNQFIKKIPNKVFTNKTSIQCINKCKLVGYSVINFDEKENSGKGICHCLNEYFEEDVLRKNGWKLMKLQTIQKWVKSEDIIVDGGLSEWQSWSICSKTCGGGMQQRIRTCTSPSPNKYGLDCGGGRTDSQHCNEQACPVDGGFTEWGNWGSCSESCDGGQQFRHRSCTNPSPSNGGANCQGNEQETQACNTIEGLLLNCGEITGGYDVGGPLITRNGNSLSGEFRRNPDRENFSGQLNNDCTGTMNFPDDRSFKIAFAKDTCKLSFWTEDESGIESSWNKDNAC